MAQYSLSVLKVLLNPTNQPISQPS